MTIPILALLTALSPSLAPVGDPLARTEVWGLQFGVTDVERSVRFYRDALGFEEAARGPDSALLRTGELLVVLHRSARRPAPAGAARVHLNLSVGQLEESAGRVEAAGGSVALKDVLASAVGPYLEVLDPDGHPLHLIDHPWDEFAAEDAPVLFNVSWVVADHEPYEPFFADIGIGVATRDYLPKTLVMEPAGAAQLVLHPGERAPAELDVDRGTMILVSRTTIVGAGDLPGFVSARPGVLGATGIELRTPDRIPVRILRAAPELR
jgi:catechol 2,3-dioxygenase-like lactoylglutathione lyase family enzyme